MKLLSTFLVFSLSYNTFASNSTEYFSDAKSIENPNTVVTKRDTNNDKKIDYVCVSIYHFNTLRNVIKEDTNYDGRFDRFTDELNGIDYYERFIAEDTDFDGYIDQITDKFRRFGGRGVLLESTTDQYDLFIDSLVDDKGKSVSREKQDYFMERKEEIERLTSVTK